MFLHIREVKYLAEYQLEVSFNNGRTGVVDFSRLLSGKIFEALHDPSVFSQATVDRELETIVWPNGADVAPEFVYYQAFKDEPDLQGQFKQWGYIV
ncbi:MAG: DUF2442 domain-containing protein [bacterium]|nr:DUF2442 domain-containing protein [bacterium]